MNKENEDKMVESLEGMSNVLPLIDMCLRDINESLKRIEKAIKKIDSGVI